MTILLCLPFCVHDLQRRRLGFQVPRYTIDLEENGESKAPKLLYLLDMQSDFSGVRKVQETSPRGSAYLDSMQKWIKFLNVCNYILFLGRLMTVLGMEGGQVKTGIRYMKHERNSIGDRRKKIPKMCYLFLSPGEFSLGFPQLRTLA